MKLPALGFVSEQWIGLYRVDELNEARKLVVEINGDSAHANPSKFKATDRIKFLRKTAKAIWAYDAERLACLRGRGYRVLVVWESDVLAVKRVQLAAMLESG